MKIHYLVAVLALVGACGQPDAEPADDMANMTADEMANMTPEEQASLPAGDPQDEADGMGPTVREAVHLTAEEERVLGVIYTTVRRETLTRTIRTVGQVLAPEPNIADVTLKIDGFVEKMYVDATGESVRKGEPLLTLYSPALVAAQEELLTAKRLAEAIDSSVGEAWHSAKSMLEAARRRLIYWDITQDQITALETTGNVQKDLVLVSPVTGIVLIRGVFRGQRVMPGHLLYQIADLTTLWIEGDVFEQDLQFARMGAATHIEVAAFPGDHIMGRVSFVYPTMDEATRTARVRVVVPNRDLLLKPGMFATMFFDVSLGADALTIPEEALIATGERNLVFVRDSTGMLQPHDVVVGHRAQGRIIILSGLSEGQEIVASGNFLIDSESRVGQAGGMLGMPGMGGTPDPAMDDMGDTP